MANAWKIAAGSDAQAWPECRDSACVLIGWRELGSHAEYDDLAALRKAMKRTYKRGEPGVGPRAARSVWRFAKEVQPGDIVVANKGRGTVVGIGVITSDYLPPRSPKIPVQHEWLTSARLVDWRITEPIRLRDYFFVQDTVWPLEPSQRDEVKRAYIKLNPRLTSKLGELFDNVEPHVSLDDLQTANLFADMSDIEGLRSEYRALRSKRSRRLRNKALALANGVCAVCRRDFSEVLDGLGRRVLQVHHCEQLSARDVPSVTRLTDLAVVCANCHLLLHLNNHKTMRVKQSRNLLRTDGYVQD